MKSVRQLFETMLDKYAFTRGYPTGDTKTRDRAVDTALEELRTWILNNKIDAQTLVGIGFNSALDKLAGDIGKWKIIFMSGRGKTIVRASRKSYNE